MYRMMYIRVIYVRLRCRSNSEAAGKQVDQTLDRVTIKMANFKYSTLCKFIFKSCIVGAFHASINGFKSYLGYINYIDLCIFNTGIALCYVNSVSCLGVHKRVL
jgi:hypothetical protein